MTPFRVYVINRSFRKKKVPPTETNPKGEIEEIEILLTPIKGAKGGDYPLLANFPDEALKKALSEFPMFAGRLCIGPLPVAHRSHQEKANAPALAEAE